MLPPRGRTSSEFADSVSKQYFAKRLWQAPPWDHPCGFTIRVTDGDFVMSITNVRIHAAGVLVAVLLCNVAEAQQRQQQTQTVTLSSLASQGFEIKAAANTAGSAAQVFLQKGKDVFICLVVLPLDAPQRETRCSPVD
jgi:hypothetical protein